MNQKALSLIICVVVIIVSIIAVKHINSMGNKPNSEIKERFYRK